jgi:4-amino-4-deoxy-L-arabinose transferase-like glycosyltransferase
MIKSTKINEFKTLNRKEWHFLAILIFVNFIIKSIVASAIDLGNDEVYYWTYALFPDWSHFDHPPMVGLVIQFFSLNLLLNSEFFIRLGSLVLSSANIVLLFFLVKKIYSIRAAYISALLFTASIYYNVITGLFILPDTPLVFFSLLALYFGIPAITSYPSKENSSKLLLFGLFTGLAL